MLSSVSPARTLMLLATAGLFAAAPLSGCGTGDATAQGDHKLNLDVPSELGTTHEEDTGVRIALLEPDTAHLGELPPKERPDAETYQQTMDNYRVEAQAQIFEESEQGTPDFQSMYVKNFEKQLSEGINRGLERFFNAKGFKTTHADDIPSIRKQQSPPFLASLPAATLAFIATVDSNECTNGICTQKGKLKLEGQYLWQLVEPTTGHPVMLRRMNLWSMSVSEPYLVQRRQTEPGLVEEIKGLFGAGPKLEDTSEEALTRALNEFYRQAMTETDFLISRGRILQLKKSIERLESDAA